MGSMIHQLPFNAATRATTTDHWEVTFLAEPKLHWMVLRMNAVVCLGTRRAVELVLFT